MTDDLLSRRPRTRLVLSEADMARLRDLYYDRDVPMTRVAAAFGLSTSTLYHGIAEMDWPRRSATFPIRTQPHRAGGGGGRCPSSRRLRRAGGTLRSATSRSRRGGELAAIGDVSGPMSQSMSLVERKRRADVIASLSRSIQRIDKPFELKAERKQLKR
jgi:hypothetical protein